MVPYVTYQYFMKIWHCIDPGLWSVMRARYDDLMQRPTGLGLFEGAPLISCIPASISGYLTAIRSWDA